MNIQPIHISDIIFPDRLFSTILPDGLFANIPEDLSLVPKTHSYSCASYRCTYCSNSDFCAANVERIGVPEFQRCLRFLSFFVSIVISDPVRGCWGMNHRCHIGCLLLLHLEKGASAVSVSDGYLSQLLQSVLSSVDEWPFADCRNLYADMSQDAHLSPIQDVHGSSVMAQFLFFIGLISLPLPGVLRDTRSDERIDYLGQILKSTVKTETQLRDSFEKIHGKKSNLHQISLIDFLRELFDVSASFFTVNCCTSNVFERCVQYHICAQCAVYWARGCLQQIEHHYRSYLPSHYKIDRAKLLHEWLFALNYMLPLQVARNFLYSGNILCSCLKQLNGRKDSELWGTHSSWLIVNRQEVLQGLNQEEVHQGEAFGLSDRVEQFNQWEDIDSTWEIVSEIVPSRQDIECDYVLIK